MCEFKVAIRRGDSEDKIAEDIIKVFYEDEKLVLMDILGNKTLVEGALIANVDVSDEKIEILQQPIVGSLIKFLEKFFECLQKGTYNLEIEEAWKEVKSRGEFMIKELREKYGKKLSNAQQRPIKLIKGSG